MRERIAQSRDVDATRPPGSPRIVKTALVAFISDPITVLVTQNRHFFAHPTYWNYFLPVNVSGRLDSSVRLPDEKVARSNTRHCINASLAQISDDFEPISGVNLNAKFFCQFCRFFFLFRRRYDFMHNRFSRSREAEICEAED